MTTSMHIRGGLILWREVLESSSRREGPPRPTRGYSLSRRFGTREIATWTEGLFCEVEADLSSKLERLRIPGLSAIDVLRPFSSTAIPASLLGFLLQVLRPAWSPGSEWNSASSGAEMRRDGFCARPRCRFCARLGGGHPEGLRRGKWRVGSGVPGGVFRLQGSAWQSQS